MTTCAPGSYEVSLSFEQERQAALRELSRRGLSGVDPVVLHLLQQ
jgi:hypothetical protein